MYSPVCHLKDLIMVNPEKSGRQFFNFLCQKWIERHSYNGIADCLYLKLLLFIIIMQCMSIQSYSYLAYDV